MQTPPTEGLRQLASARKDSMDFLLFFLLFCAVKNNPVSSASQGALHLMDFEG